MILTLVKHELKEFWRSKNKGKHLAIIIIMGFAIAYIFLNVLAVGYFMDIFLEHLFPNDDLIVAFCGIMLSYFLGDLLMRNQLQELPTLRVQPYLHLPIHKNTLVGYLSLTSFRSVFNLWPWMLFVPFIIKVVKPEYGTATSIAFIIAIAGLVVFNNCLSLYVKRKGNLNGFIGVGFALFLAVLGLADYSWHLISLKTYSFFFFGNLLKYPLLALIPLAAGISLFLVNFAYLKKNLYLEELKPGESKFKGSSNLSILNSWGKPGELMASEIKLILRNKRPRSSLIMCLLFLLYGLIFYTNKAYGDGWKVFCGMFMTGIFIINYGQFLYSWQSAHFDGILVNKINFRDFLKGKFLLFTTISTAAFVLITPYVYFGWHVLFVHTVMYLWNIGVNTTIILFFANRNFKRLNLTRGASFNWEGVGATQMLMSVPLLLTPYVIYGPFALFNRPDTGLVILAVVGLGFIFTRGWWINKLEADFNEKKYDIAEGFRTK